MEATFACPQCGHKVPPGTPTCGNCGNDLRPYFRGDPMAGPASAASPKVIRRLALAGLLIGLFVLYSGQVKERLDEVGRGFETDPIEVTEIPAPQTRSPRGYDSARRLIADLRAGGLPCNRVKIDTVGPPVETGSCQSRGTHVQVSVYLTAPSLDMAKEVLSESPFANVHRDNWWVITSEPTARRVRAILGGKLTKDTL